MEIFQHEDTELGRRQHFHGLGEFPEHALPCGRPCVPLQRLILGRGHERGELKQPAWRLLAQQRHQLGASRRTPHLPQRF